MGSHITEGGPYLLRENKPQRKFNVFGFIMLPGFGWTTLLLEFSRECKIIVGN
jgi:hypothetical protein